MHLLSPPLFLLLLLLLLYCIWNVIAHVQEPDLVFQQNGRVYLNQWGSQFSRLLAVKECRSAVVMLDRPCSEVVWRVLATCSIRLFPLHFLSCASPCAIRFQLTSTTTLPPPHTLAHGYFSGIQHKKELSNEFRRSEEMMNMDWMTRVTAHNYSIKLNIKNKR